MLLSFDVFIIVSQHCEWHCEPGCYCTDGKVLSANGTVCLAREDCPCLDLKSGHRLEPGEISETPDGCNNWSEYNAQKELMQYILVHHIISQLRTRLNKYNPLIVCVHLFCLLVLQHM